VTARRARNTAGILAALTAIAFVVVWFLSWTLLSNSDKFGRVDVPGHAVIHLPAGETEVSFRTLLATNGGNGGLRIPPLSLGIDPVDDGADDPTLREDYGPSSSVNGDIHARVWRLQVESEGDYGVAADGEVGGYIQPQLTFGADSSVSGILIALAIATAVLVAIMLAALVIARRQDPGPELV
jgi:hypothetical protein